MTGERTIDFRTPRAFAVVALGVATICVALIHSRLFARNPDVAAWGVTIDLMVTIPATFYFLVVRNGRASLASMIPLFAVCGLMSRLVIPLANQQLLHSLGFVISAPLELLTIG